MLNGSSRWGAIMVISVAVLGAGVHGLMVASPASAQGVTAQGLSEYIRRAGYSWERDEKSPDVLRVTKTTGLKRAQRVELVITNLPKSSIVTLRAFPKLEGKYLNVAGIRDAPGLAQHLLKRNATAFGAYFIDDEGDVGFRYVFTTESGLGYEAFKTAVGEILRIADEPLVEHYLKYR